MIINHLSITTPLHNPIYMGYFHTFAIIFELRGRTSNAHVPNAKGYKPPMWVAMGNLSTRSKPRYMPG